VVGCNDVIFAGAVVGTMVLPGADGDAVAFDVYPGGDGGAVALEVMPGALGDAVAFDDGVDGVFDDGAIVLLLPMGAMVGSKVSTVGAVAFVALRDGAKVETPIVVGETVVGERVELVDPSITKDGAFIVGKTVGGSSTTEVTEGVVVWTKLVGLGVVGVSTRTGESTISGGEGRAFPVTGAIEIKLTGCPVPIGVWVGIDVLAGKMEGGRNIEGTSMSRGNGGKSCFGEGTLVIAGARVGAGNVWTYCEGWRSLRLLFDFLLDFAFFFFFCFSLPLPFPLPPFPELLPCHSLAK
jgi:hypothetical protein